uniref:Helicase C-terminal domain-containing protein n=1 Tax=Ditylenchus dipsaci TaxID=166011 RepID=A0A915DTR6_9BILA
MEDVISIRTNTNRINALLASSLFYFGFLPATITPMIQVDDIEIFLLNLEVMRVVHRLGRSFRTLEVFTLLQHNPAIRFRIARFLCDLACVDMLSMLNTYYTNLYLVRNIGSDSERCGVVLLICVGKDKGDTGTQVRRKFAALPIEGITWMCFLNKFGLMGVLADDMLIYGLIHLSDAWLFIFQSQLSQQIHETNYGLSQPKATEQQTKEGEEALKKLHNRILPFILRRLKSEVLKELPEKVVFKKEDEHGDPQFSPLHTLILLRKLVDHPILVADNLAGIRDLKHWNVADSNYELSGKMVALKELLEECQIGRQSVSEDPSEVTDLEPLNKLSAHRALIFCQWKASLHGHQLLRLDGSIAADDRQGVVDHFNRDTSVDLLLLTTHIGGVGLTLTGADVVIFVDHDWNPVKDLQAIDRAHRLGQTKTVNVYRLITLGSVEEKVMRLQKFKTNTADVLVGGAENRSLTAMAGAELKDLLSLGEKDESSTSEDPPNKRIKNKNLDGTAFSDQKWSLESLWDNSQYEEQHSLESFMKCAND